MFISNFKEKNQEKIVLKDLELTEFLELLYVIYSFKSNLINCKVFFNYNCGDDFIFEFDFISDFGVFRSLRIRLRSTKNKLNGFEGLYALL